jgi:pyroglutamyl-peptidase I
MMNDTAQPTRTLIVTGFEPFGGAEENPSGNVALSLDGGMAGAWRLRGLLLPVSAPAAWQYLHQVIRSERADAVIALGLAADRAEVCVECVARNLADYSIPDNCGRQPRGESIVPGAPENLPPLANPDAILTALLSSGLPARLSADAGHYVCNDLYFRLLHGAAAGEPALRSAVFIHLPEAATVAPDRIHDGILAVVRSLDAGFRIRGLDHVQLAMPPQQEESARRFYGKLLGLTEVPKPANLAARGGVWFTGGDLRLHLGVETGFRPAKKAHPAMLVENLDALVARLEANGVRVVTDEPLEGFRRVYVADPFGNRIELLEPERGSIG